MTGIFSCLLLNSGVTILFAVLFAISEALGNNKKIKSNSVYQFIHNFLTSANSKKKE